jgi:hypothetical protein
MNSVRLMVIFIILVVISMDRNYTASGEKALNSELEKKVNYIS